MYEIFSCQTVTMENADADEIIVPLCIIIICAGFHQLRGQVVSRRFWVRPWIRRRSIFGAYHALLKELSKEDQKGSKTCNKIVYKHKHMCHESMSWIFLGHMSVSHWDLGKVVSIKLYGIGHALSKPELDATPKRCMKQSFSMGYTVSHDTVKLHRVAQPLDFECILFWMLKLTEFTLFLIKFDGIW